MKKQVMKRAWEIRRAAANQFNCKVSSISMSACLIQAWAESKMEKELWQLRIQGKIGICRELEGMGFSKEKFSGYYSYIKRNISREELENVVEMLDENYGCRWQFQFGRTPLWYADCPMEVAA